MNRSRITAVIAVAGGAFLGFAAANLDILPLSRAADGKAPAATKAPQVTGTPGSPSATETISGNQIPAPEPKFGGVIKETLEGSKTWWPPRIVPPKGAPNILLIMTDDKCDAGASCSHIRRESGQSSANWDYVPSIAEFGAMQ
jgi:hypothetical protein